MFGISQCVLVPRYVPRCIEGKFTSKFFLHLNGDCCILDCKDFAVKKNDTVYLHALMSSFVIRLSIKYAIEKHKITMQYWGGKIIEFPEELSVETYFLYEAYSIKSFHMKLIGILEYSELTVSSHPIPYLLWSILNLIKLLPLSSSVCKHL